MNIIIAVLSAILWLAPADVSPMSPLPDAHLTPGATNSAITQETIDQTICSKHWSTKSIRPSVRYTNRIKRMQMNRYRRAGTMHEYELDHLIPLELGGDPTDVRNLWPEPWTLDVDGEDLGAHTKDKVENFLHDAVCSGAMPLDEAQRDISTDWTVVWHAIEKWEK